MDNAQEQAYGEYVDKWREAVKQYGTGWDEDGPEIPVDYPLDVDMVNYFCRGLFEVSDGMRYHVFTNPKCDVLARVRKVKAHMNRMISAMEFAADHLRHTDPHANVEPVTERPNPNDVHRPDVTMDFNRRVDAWDFARLATLLLADAHHGSLYRVVLRSRILTRLAGHCTGIPSSLPWDIGIGVERQRENDDPDAKLADPVYLFELRTTVFTVCPFVLHETDGKQSHTQRTHIELQLRTTGRVDFDAILREIAGRLVPVMSNMKIPDETVQVLKSYSGPTFTEDGAVRVQKILRGITAEFLPDGQVLNCRVRAISEDSHLAHDIVTTLENDLGETD